MSAHPAADLDFVRDGAQLFRGALNADDLAYLRTLADASVGERPGRRLGAVPAELAALLSSGAAGRIAAQALGEAARPVRLVVFDKTAAANWSVAWHQDRTIAVRERRDVEGFGPWSVKDGVLHVAPPTSVLERMITLRLHLDRCGADNAPLEIAPGSHRLGSTPAHAVRDTALRIGALACHADAGDIWLYSTLILHASAAAATPARRRVVQIDYAAFDLPGGLEWRGLDLS